MEGNAQAQQDKYGDAAFAGPNTELLETNSVGDDLAGSVNVEVDLQFFDQIPYR